MKIEVYKYYPFTCNTCSCKNSFYAYARNIGLTVYTKCYRCKFIYYYRTYLCTFCYKLNIDWLESDKQRSSTACVNCKKVFQIQPLEYFKDNPKNKLFQQISSLFNLFKSKDKYKLNAICNGCSTDSIWIMKSGDKDAIVCALCGVGYSCLCKCK